MAAAVYFVRPFGPTLRRRKKPSDGSARPYTARCHPGSARLEAACDRRAATAASRRSRESPHIEKVPPAHSHLQRFGQVGLGTSRGGSTPLKSRQSSWSQILSIVEGPTPAGAWRACCTSAAMALHNLGGYRPAKLVFQTVTPCRRTRPCSCSCGRVQLHRKPKVERPANVPTRRVGLR